MDWSVIDWPMVASCRDCSFLFPHSSQIYSSYLVGDNRADSPLS